MVDLCVPARGIQKLTSSETQDDELEASLMLSDSDDEEGAGGNKHVVMQSTSALISCH